MPAVLSHLPFVDEVITHERKRWRDYPALFARLAARRYDVVVDGLVLRPSVNSYTTLLMLASKARWRIGSDGRPHDGVYNVPVAPPRHVYHEHHVQHLARLAAPLGVGPGDSDWRPSLVVTTAEREAARARWAAAAGYGPRILVNISAGRSVPSMARRSIRHHAARAAGASAERAHRRRRARARADERGLPRRLHRRRGRRTEPA